MKRIMSVILIVIILLSFCAVRPSAYTSIEIAYGLSLLKGTGSGLDAAYLALSPSRTNAAMIVLRLLGLENEALACTLTNTFSDAGNATAYWHPILKYLYANPSVGFSGYTNGSFKPNDGINGQMLTKVLLTVLGYKQDVDFTWSGTFAFASSIGMKALYGKNSITNSDVAAALVEVLSIRTKDSATLVTELVTAGVINLDMVEKYGLEIENTEVIILSVKATGVRTVTVTFLNPVPKDTTVVLKKNYTGISNTYAFSSNRTVLTITTSAILTAGTYMVAVSDKAYMLDIDVEKASSLVITGTKLYRSALQDVGVKLLNQYGETMSLSYVKISVTNKTAGTRNVTISKTASLVLLDASNTSIGDKIYIYALDNQTLLSDSVTLTVQAVPAIKKISITYLSSANAIYENTSAHVITVTAYDQYGQTYVLKQSDIDSGVIKLLSTNNLCVNTGSVRVNSDGDLIFNASNEGTTRLRVIVVSEGIDTYCDITVLAAPRLNSISIDDLPGTIFKNERIEVGVIAYDQYNNIYEIKSTDMITYRSSNTLSIPEANIAINNGILSFHTIDSGTSIINCYFSGRSVEQFTVMVNNGNVPYIITGIDMEFIYFEMGFGNIEIKLSKILTVDQYGGSVSLSERPAWDTVKWGIVIEKLSGNSFTYAGNILSTSGNAGTDVFNVFITRDSQKMEGSCYVLAVTNVETKDITKFEIDTPESIYGGAVGRTDAHTGYITIKGYTILGYAVQLKTDSNGYPTVITEIKISSDKIYIDTTTWAIRFNSYFTENSVVLIQYLKDGAEVDRAEITINAAGAKVGAMEYDANQTFVINTSSFTTLPIKFYDQYGIEMSMPADSHWLENCDQIDRNTVVFDAVTKCLTFEVKGVLSSNTDFMLTYIAPDGTWSFSCTFTVLAGTY